MITFLMFVLKSSVILAGAWMLCRCKWFSAAQRHLILLLAIMSLPLLVLINQIPNNALTFVTPADVSAWEIAIKMPVVDLEIQGPMKQHPSSFDVYELVRAIYWIGAVAFVAVWLVRLLNTGSWIGPTRVLTSLQTSSTARAIPLRESTRLSSPMTWGVVAPKILVPKDWSSWSEDRKRAALIHELAHIARHDTLTTMLAGLVCCVFWLHPMLWITHRKMRIEAERACDDAVIESGASNIEYAGLLLEIARECRVGMALAMASPRMLSTRIHAILDNTLRRSPMNRKQLGLTLLLAIAIVVPLGSLKAESDNQRIPMSSDSDLLPIVKVGTVYPPDARAKGTEGFVVVQFTVSETGEPTDTMVLLAEPLGVFEEAALQAVLHYKYKPRVVDGKPVAVAGIRNRITFKLPGGSSVENGPVEKIPAMSEDLYSHLTAMRKFIDHQEFESAQVELNEMKQDVKLLNGNELGQMYNMAGFLAYSTGDTWQAILEYEQVVAQGDAVPQGLRSTTLFTLAQLNFSVEEFDSALKHIAQWMNEADSPGPTPLIFMAQTYYQLNDYPAAIERLEAGLEEAKHRNHEIKENWWALLAYLYYEETRWSDVISVLEILNEEFPGKKYKARLQGVRGILADQQSEAS